MQLHPDRPSILRLRARRLCGGTLLAFAGVLFCACQASAPIAGAARTGTFDGVPRAARGSGPAASPAPGSAPIAAQVPVDPVLRADVLALAHPDFVARAHASERLVQAGVRALPELGRAGDQPVTVHGSTRVSTTRPVIEAIMVAATGEAVEQQLAAHAPLVRREAALELGRRGVWEPIPALLVRLQDRDDGVRAATVSALRRLTNQFFGYEAQAGAGRRLAAVTRWRTWWAREGRQGAEEARGPGAR